MPVYKVDSGFCEPVTRDFSPRFFIKLSYSRILEFWTKAMKRFLSMILTSGKNLDTRALIAQGIDSAKSGAESES
jgi:hypothetical protein